MLEQTTTEQETRLSEQESEAESFTEQLASQQPSFWYGVAFFVFVVLAVVAFCLTMANKMSAQQSVPVTQLSISGEMPYTVKQDIEVALNTVNLGNFFKVSVDEVQEKIASLPWVYSVSVRKQWPNKLNIYVVDQVPIARWNGDFFINQYGDAFQVTSDRIHHQVPAFYGPEGTEKLAVENFENLNKLLDFSALSINELVLSERYSWQLTLNDGVTLNLGRENRVERIQRFMDIYPEIKMHKSATQKIKYIDLRYDTGMAVGWATTEDKQRV